MGLFIICVVADGAGEKYCPARCWANKLIFFSYISSIECNCTKKTDATSDV